MIQQLLSLCFYVKVTTGIIISIGKKIILKNCNTSNIICTLMLLL